jgi:hypothetical protein
MDLRAHEEEAAAALKAKTEQKARLESELSMLTDKEYIEEQARERLGMMKQGEILYVFEDKAAAATTGEGTDATVKDEASDADSGSADGADETDEDAARGGESEE